VFIVAHGEQSGRWAMSGAEQLQNAMFKLQRHVTASSKQCLTESANTYLSPRPEIFINTNVLTYHPLSLSV
jgi:hypothetical protein